MPAQPCLPLSITEDALGLTLVLPSATDSPASAVETAVQAFRQAIATVYTARILRAAAALFQAHPDAPAFTLSWEMCDDMGTPYVVPRSTTSTGGTLEDFSFGAEVTEEIMGVHTDPEVIGHLNDWLSRCEITPSTVDDLGRRLVGEGWDHVRLARDLGESLPGSARPRARRKRV